MATKHFPKGLDDRMRDSDGEIRKKRGDTLVGTLRKTYGENFAKGHAQICASIPFCSVSALSRWTISSRKGSTAHAEPLLALSVCSPTESRGPAGMPERSTSGHTRSEATPALRAASESW